MIASPPSVVFLNRFYWPDLAATAQQLTDLAEDLAAAGLAVTVVASRSAYDEPDRTLPRRETRNGVRIIRLPTSRFGRARLLGRALDYFTYWVGAWLWLLRGRRADVVVACSDPPFILAAAVMAARVRGFKVIYNVRDLYPHLAARLGVVRNGGRLHRLLDRYARRLHGAVDGVVALGPRMAAEMVASGAPVATTTHIWDGVDTNAIRPVPAERNPLVEELDLDGRFVVLYAGNAGRAHTFDAVLGAACRLRDDPDVVFLFIGGGRERPRLEEEVEREGLGNVRFMDYVSREQLSLSLSLADVSLVTERPDLVGLLVPCKTYGILASGRPLVFIGSERSDVAGVVRATRCGHVVPADQPAQLASVLRRLKENPHEREETGRRSRRAAESTFERSVTSRAWYHYLVERVCIPSATSVGAAEDHQPRRIPVATYNHSE